MLLSQFELYLPRRDSLQYPARYRYSFDMKDNINEEIFSNMPEVPGRFTGLGIKKMPA